MTTKAQDEALASFSKLFEHEDTEEEKKQAAERRAISLEKETRYLVKYFLKKLGIVPGHHGKTVGVLRLMKPCINNYYPIPLSTVKKIVAELGGVFVLPKRSSGRTAYFDFSGTLRTAKKTKRKSKKGKQTKKEVVK